jgi:hypothetical protein
MFSDKLTQWDNPVVLQNLVFHGNLHKLGCGSPLWTEEWSSPTV